LVSLLVLNPILDVEKTVSANTEKQLARILFSIRMLLLYPQQSKQVFHTSYYKTIIYKITCTIIACYSSFISS